MRPYLQKQVSYFNVAAQFYSCISLKIASKHTRTPPVSIAHQIQNHTALPTSYDSRLESKESYRYSLIAISEPDHKRKSSNDNHNHYNFLAQPQSCNYISSRPSR